MAKLKIGIPSKIKWKLALILSIVSLILIAASYSYYSSEKSRILRDKSDDLNSITHLKAKEILQWRQERSSEANYFSTNPSFIWNTKNLLANKNITESKVYLTQRLSPIKSSHSYQNIFIAALSGKILFSLDSTFISADPSDLDYIQKMKEQRKIIFRDFYYSGSENKILYDMLAPIIDNDVVIGVLVLRINPNDYFFSLVQSWPILSKTAEILLFRKENDHILFLNELRHKKNTALKEKIPLTQTKIVAVIAASGKEGIIEAKDYRNVEVLADVHKIPGTPWFMVSKIDSSEVYSELGMRVVFVVFISFIVLLLVTTGLAMVYNYRRVTIYKELLNERKKAEEVLKISENKFSSIFQTSPDAINISRISDRICIDINQNFCNVMGYEREEVIGKTSLELNLWDDPKDRDKLFQILSKDGEVSNFEAPFRKKNGEIVIGLISARKILLNGEECILSITKDITERKRVESNIRKLSRGLEQSPATIVITDIQGNIEYVNPKFTEITGYSFDEVKNKNPRILKSGDKHAEEYSELWKTILSGKEWRGEFQNKKKNGDLYWESASISPIINEKGKITNFIAIKEDITKYKKITEELIKAKDKAEEMNRVKSFFFANVSHELRTPFVGIMGYAEILKDTLQDPEVKEMAEVIFNSSSRLVDTLNKILNIAKLEFDKPEIHPAKIDIPAILSDLRILYSKSAQQKNTFIKYEFLSGSMIFTTDEIILQEILTNLVSNAVKYTNNGLIEIYAKTIHKNQKQRLIMTIKDNGIGIPKEKQEIIWQEFRQASEGFSRSFEGTGLGLSIVKKYIEMLGGEIFLNSEVGKGSEFTIELPEMELSDNSIEKRHQKKIIKTKTNEKKSDKSILLVEDDITSQNFVKKVLEKYHEVDIACSANEALKRLEEKNYSIFLFDINLGDGMNGTELIQLVNEIPKYSKVPKIAVTAYATSSERDEFLKQGFSHYISKPFNSNDLIELVNQALT